MTSPDHKERRGEPVLLLRDGDRVFEPPLPGTIEWGTDCLGYSICTEPGGARFQARVRDFVPDPGGPRPLWERRRAEDGENVRVEIQKTIDRAAREVVEAAMTAMNFRSPSSTGHLDLHAACVVLNVAERRLEAARTPRPWPIPDRQG